MPLPSRVRWKKQGEGGDDDQRRRDDPEVLRQERRPGDEIGLSPEKGASARLLLPSVTSTPPRKTIETPIVMMMRVVTSASRAGSIASSWPRGGRSARRSAIAPTTASASGRPAEASDAAIMPPSMMNSPWAKLITPEAL